MALPTGCFHAPATTRTRNLGFRRALLYPFELLGLKPDYIFWEFRQTNTQMDVTFGLRAKPRGFARRPACKNIKRQGIPCPHTPAKDNQWSISL